MVEKSQVLLTEVALKISYKELLSFTILSLRVKHWSNNITIQYCRFSRVFSGPRDPRSSPKPPYSDRHGALAGDPIFTHFGLDQTLNFS